MDPEPAAHVDAIERLKYRYVRSLDLKDWEALRDCLTDDASASYGGGAHEIEGAGQIVDWLRAMLGSPTMLTTHRVSQPEIDLTGPSSAEGIWALDDVVIMEDLDVTVRGAAFYQDRYRLSDGEWRICHTGYKRIYEELFPRSSVEGLQLTASWWGTDGRSLLPAEPGE